MRDYYCLKSIVNRMLLFLSITSERDVIKWFILLIT